MSQVKYLLLGFLLYCTTTAAQTISGVVIDEDSKAVMYANVVLLNAKDSAYVAGVTTHEDGSFSLSSDYKGKILRVSCIGYATKYFDCKQSDMGVLVLLSESKELGEVVVKANQPRVRLEADGMKVTVQGSVLEKAGRMENLLNRIPNVSVVNGNIEVFGRGTPVIYINGRKMLDKTTLKSLTADNIKSVEVITSPGSRYGSEVTSVLNIVTKKPQGEGLGMEITPEGNISEQGYLGGSGDLVVNYRKGGLDLRANIYGEHIHKQDDKIMKQATFLKDTWHQTNNISQENKSDNMYYTLEGSYQFDANNSVGMKVSMDKYPQMKTYGNMYSSVLKNSVLNETSFNTISNPGNETDYSANVYYSGKIKSMDVSLNVDWYKNKYSIDMFNTEEYENLLDGSVNRQDVSTSRNTSNNLLASKLVLSTQLWNGMLSFGTEISGTHRNNTYNVLPKGIVDDDDSRFTEYMYSGFMEYARRFGNVMVKAGLRYENIDFKYYENGQFIAGQSKKYNHLLPSLALMMPVGNTQMQLAYTSSIKRPTYWQLRSGVQYDNRYTYEAGNPFIDPQVTHGVTYTLAYKWMMFYTAFNNISKPILQLVDTYEDDPTISLMRPDNYHNYKTWATSVVVQPVFGIWHPSLSISILKQWFDMHTQDNRNMNTPIGQIRFDNTLDTKFCSVSLMLNAMTAGAQENTYIKKGIFVANLSAEKSFLNDKLSVMLQAEDLFGTGNQHFNIYSQQLRTTELTNYSNTKVSVSLTYKFNATQRRYKGESAGKAQRERM